MSNDGDSSAKYPERPTKLELDAQVTSLHFSPQINELLSTHGGGRVTEVPSLFNAEPLHARFGQEGGTCRASFGLYTTEAEVDTLAEALTAAREFFA